MTIAQKEITLGPYPRGFHLITKEVDAAIEDLRKKHKFSEGICHLLLKHTSASLTLNENADPDVRHDLSTFVNRMAPENDPAYRHTIEGPDDMPAHIKSSVLGVNLSLPIHAGRLNLGTWQGVYLCEHRNRGGKRILSLTIIAD